MERIKIFTTGGTIDKVYFDAKSDYQIGEPLIRDILEEALVTTAFDVEQLMSKDSLELTDEDRRLIKDRVLAESGRNVLITHGTDTMVETALTLQDVPNKVIVLVGSLTPARFKTTDALFNIGFAFAAVQALSEGVYITMNGRIFHADQVRKNRAENRFEALPLDA